MKPSSLMPSKNLSHLATQLHYSTLPNKKNSGELKSRRKERWSRLPEQNEVNLEELQPKTHRGLKKMKPAKKKRMLEQKEHKRRIR